MPRVSVLGGAVLFSLALSTPVAGQEISLMAGRAEYDLSGVHTSPVWAVRAASQAASSLWVEASVSYIHTRQQFGRSAFWIPELQLQLSRSWGRIAPYFGAGIGMAIDNPERDGRDTEVDLATSLAAGVILALSDRVGVRVDGRVHGIEIDFTGTVTGLTAGVVIGL